MPNLILGIFIPFVGTSLGAAMVFFMRKQFNKKLEQILLGFAAGVMVAASVWSLIIPAVEQSESMGSLSFIPAAVGIVIGVLFLLILDYLITRLYTKRSSQEVGQLKFKKTTMLVLAVTLHNIPEGMAVGVVLAGAFFGEADISMMGALILSIGIAIQNFPEGAIISMPLKVEGMSKSKAFIYGVLSGIVEPIAAVITILLTSIVTPILPYLLSFAAGAMIYVVIEELIPDSQNRDGTNISTLSFVIGFELMMILDIALG